MNRNDARTLFLISSFGEVSLLLNEINKVSFSNIVVFDNEDLYRFLKTLDFKNHEIDFVRKPKHSIKNPLSYVKARIYYKKKINSLSKKFRGIKKIHCFHIYGNIFCYKLAKKIISHDSEFLSYECLKFSRSNKLIHYPQFIARTIMIIFLHGINAKVFPTEHKYLETFDLSSIKCNLRTIKFNECQKIRKVFSIRKYFSYSHSYSHVFFDQPVVNYGRVTDQEYSTFMNKIKKHYSDEIKNKRFCIKLHPGNHSDIKFYDGLEIIPSFIPSECLETNINSVWLAISSQTLWANNDAKKIALINLIKYESAISQSYILESLLIKHKNVLIPETFEDLKKI